MTQRRQIRPCFLLFITTVCLLILSQPIGGAQAAGSDFLYAYQTDLICLVDGELQENCNSEYTCDNMFTLKQGQKVELRSSCAYVNEDGMHQNLNFHWKLPQNNGAEDYIVINTTQSGESSTATIEIPFDQGLIDTINASSDQHVEIETYCQTDFVSAVNPNYFCFKVEEPELLLTTTLDRVTMVKDNFVQLTVVLDGDIHCDNSTCSNALTAEVNSGSTEANSAAALQIVPVSYSASRSSPFVMSGPRPFHIAPVSRAPYTLTFKIYGRAVGSQSVTFTALGNGYEGQTTSKTLMLTVDSQPTVEGAAEVEGCTPPAETATTSTFYFDSDQDGYGDPLLPSVTEDLTTGTVANNLDCNDENILVHPGKMEECSDGVDNDCDGSVDETDCFQPLGDTQDVAVDESVVTTGDEHPAAWGCSLVL